MMITDMILHTDSSPGLPTLNPGCLRLHLPLFPFPPAMMRLLLLELLSWQFSQVLFCLQELYLFLFSVWTTTALRGVWMWSIPPQKQVSVSTGETAFVLVTRYIFFSENTKTNQHKCQISCQCKDIFHFRR